MISKTLILLFFCISLTRSQNTFGTLSSSAFRSSTTTTTATAVSTGFTFGTLSTRPTTNTATSSSSTSTTTSTTTVSTFNTECPPVEKAACKNGASCVYLENSFAFCVCTDNFIGIDCSIPIDTIGTTVPTTTAPTVEICPVGISSICKNGGSCFILDGREIICNCQSGFTGEFCESTITSVATSNCPVNICKNGATCLISSDNKDVSCLCKPGYSGLLCQDSGSFCDSNPCKNGAICAQTDSVNGACLCQNTYYGRFCETQSCFPNPCQNDQICVLASNKPQCLCSAEYSGSYCEKKL